MDAEHRAAYKKRLLDEATAFLDDPAVAEVLESAAERLIAEGVAPVDDPHLVAAAILSTVDDATRNTVTKDLQDAHDAGTPWSTIAMALGVDRTTVYSTYAEGARKRNRKAQRRHRERLQARADDSSD